MTLVLSFLAGAVPFGYLLYRLTDKADIRRMGSGNIGASNVLRNKGIPYGILILFLDSTKGALPLILFSGELPQNRPYWAMIMLAAILGHIYSPFLKGKGGKGVATFFGALIVFSPLISLIFLAVFTATVFLFRFVSAASVTAVSIAFFCVLFTHSADVSMILLLSVLIIIISHRQNIQRILSGIETRLGKRTCHE